MPITLPCSPARFWAATPTNCSTFSSGSDRPFGFGDLIGREFNPETQRREPFLIAATRDLDENFVYAKERRLVKVMGYLEGPTRVFVDKRGSLPAFYRDFPPGTTFEKLSLEESKSLAEGAVREYFKRDPVLLRLESDSDAVRLGTRAPMPAPEATTFVWRDLGDTQGLLQRYVVRLVGRDIAYLDQRPEVPLGERTPVLPGFWGVAVASSLIALRILVGLFQRKRVDLAAPWRIASAAFGFLLGVWMAAPLAMGIIQGIPTVVSLLLLVASALLGTLGNVLASVTAEICLSKVGRAKLTRFAHSCPN